MYKVFINDKPLLIIQSKDSGIVDDGLVKIISNPVPRDIEYAILMLEEGGTHSVHLLSDHPAKTWLQFTALYTRVEAAGGVVVNKKNEFLFIFRNGKWDLPKGKIETGESTEEAAIREVEEECGIKGVKISHELPSTFHTYTLNDKRTLKQTSWYRMDYAGNEKLSPQEEEGITDIKWISPSGFPDIFKNSYASIREVIERMKK